MIEGEWDIQQNRTRPIETFVSIPLFAETYACRIRLAFGQMLLIKLETRWSNQIELPESEMENSSNQYVDREVNCKCEIGIEISG
jgi:endonuclease/exonuclease/phosphatase family metal-dependent hydrolase